MSVSRIPVTPGCEFGLCRRDAELRVKPSPAVEPLLVCGLHVTPVLSWGVVPDFDAVIEHLATRPEHRRDRRNRPASAA